MKSVKVPRFELVCPELRVEYPGEPGFSEFSTQRKPEDHRGPQSGVPEGTHYQLTTYAPSVTMFAGGPLIASNRSRSLRWPSVILGFSLC